MRTMKKIDNTNNVKMMKVKKVNVSKERDNNTKELQKMEKMTTIKEMKTNEDEIQKRGTACGTGPQALDLSEFRHTFWDRTLREQARRTHNPLEPSRLCPRRRSAHRNSVGPAPATAESLAALSAHRDNVSTRWRSTACAHAVPGAKGRPPAAAPAPGRRRAPRVKGGSQLQQARPLTRDHRAARAARGSGPVSCAGAAASVG